MGDGLRAHGRGVHTGGKDVQHFCSHLEVLQYVVHDLGVGAQQRPEQPLGLVFCCDLQLRLDGLE